MLVYNSKFLPRPGFLLLEFLVALVLGLTFIFVSLHFQSRLVSMYENLFMRRIALDLAINAIEDSDYMRNSQGCNIAGRIFKLRFKNTAENGSRSENDKGSQVVITWDSYLGKNEKLKLFG